MKRRLFGRRPPPRRWFAYSDGTFYRNCPLIKAEQDEVMAWPPTRRKFALLDALIAEWHETFRRGVQEKDHLGAGDVLIEPAPMRVTHPDKPGLWALDELPLPSRPPPAWLKEEFPPWHWPVTS